MQSHHDGIEVLRDFHEAVVWKRGGEVVLRSGSETGRVFFVKGRIAWAAASTIKRTFMGYLVENTDLSRDQLQEVFDACKASGDNFGETIVDWGLMEESALRHLLLLHLSECLLEIFTWPQVESMFVPEERAYKGSFTYDLREVLEAVLGMDKDGRLPFDDPSVDRLMEEVEARPLPSDPHPEVAVAAGSPMRRRPLAWLGGGILVGLLLVLAVVLYLGKLPFVDTATEEATGSLDGATPPIAPDATVDSSSPDLQPTSQPASAPVPPDQAQRPDGIVVGIKGQGRGSMQVLSRPSRARLYLDGVDTGRRTPYTFKRVQAGNEHVVMVHRPGYLPEAKRFNLAPNMEAKLRFSLRRQPRRQRRRQRPGIEPIPVRIETVPPGATVFINRRRQELTTPAEVLLNPNAASLVELRLKGFRRWRSRMRPVPKVPLTYKIELRSIKKRRARRGRPRYRRRR